MTNPTTTPTPGAANAPSTKLSKAGSTVLSMLEANRAQLAAALPSHIKPERMIRVVTTTLRRNPGLLKCDPASLLSAIMQSAQLGLEIDNGLGHAYVVPFKAEAVFIPGYKGLVDLARRSGQVSTIYAHVVRPGDVFDYELGLNPKLLHKPGVHEKPVESSKDVSHAYAVCKLRDGGSQFDVMTTAEVERIRSMSRAGKSGPWVTDWEAMAKKTVLRRLCKLLPTSVELQKAVALDEQADANLPQTFDLDPSQWTEAPEPENAAAGGDGEDPQGKLGE